MLLVHCINLPHRTDRRLSAEEQAKEQGFRLQFWDGIADVKQAYTNISRAHKQIVRQAKRTNMPSVIIMEDDCLFTHKNSFKFFLKNKPKQYDLYMGLIYAGSVEKGRVLNGFSGGLTLYSIRSGFYDTFLSADETDHLDRWCGKIAFKHQFYMCDPMVVIQSGGYSDNFQSVKNYDDYLIGKKLYTGE